MIQEFDNLQEDLKLNGLPLKEPSIRLMKESSMIKEKIEKIHIEMAGAMLSGKYSKEELILMTQTLEPVIKQLEERQKELSSEIEGKIAIFYDARQTTLMAQDPFQKIDLGIN